MSGTIVRLLPDKNTQIIKKKVKKVFNIVAKLPAAQRKKSKLLTKGKDILKSFVLHWSLRSSSGERDPLFR